MIEGECLGNLAIPHDGKADCIDETKGLVVVATENALCLRFEWIIGVDPYEARAIGNQAEETYPRIRTGDGPDCFVRFRDDEVGRHHQTSLADKTVEKL